MIDRSFGTHRNRDSKFSKVDMGKNEGNKTSLDERVTGKDIGSDLICGKQATCFHPSGVVLRPTVVSVDVDGYDDDTP